MSNEYDWNDVESIIEDLKQDGYTVRVFKSSTAEATPEKAFLLWVNRDE